MKININITPATERIRVALRDNILLKIINNY